jgi:nucleoside-diphosphate-sugar epimerase
MADKVVNRFEDKLMEIYLRGGWPTKVMKRVKRVLQSTPSGAELNDLFSRNAVYSDAKARELIGYKPLFDLDQGLKLSVQWLQLNELLRETVSDQAEDWIHGTSADWNVEAVQS